MHFDLSCPKCKGHIINIGDSPHQKICEECLHTWRHRLDHDLTK
jgi:hypothetical protein